MSRFMYNLRGRVYDQGEDSVGSRRRGVHNGRGGVPGSISLTQHLTSLASGFDLSIIAIGDVWGMMEKAVRDMGRGMWYMM